MNGGIAGFYAIPGYEGRYEIDYHANIQRIWSVSGKKTQMSPTLKKGEMIIRLLKPNGKRTQYKVSHLMAMTFIKRYKKGMAVYHVDGVKTNNTLSNLQIISKKDLGKLTGAAARRRPVVKISAEGAAVEFYSSAREAARKNYMSYQAVMDCCNGKIKRKTAADGYVYKWSDDYENDRPKAKTKGNLLDELMKGMTG